MSRAGATDASWSVAASRHRARGIVGGKRDRGGLAELSRGNHLADAAKMDIVWSGTARHAGSNKAPAITQVVRHARRQRRALKMPGATC